MSGRLLVLATPIGNLGDLSSRAAEHLRTADLVLAEDTRRTGKLLAHVGSEAAQRSLHDHNERARVRSVLAELDAGKRIVLVSDAGTPGVSDPGYHVIAAAIEAGYAVEPIPGPSAVLAALMTSGLPSGRFVFEGFLPRKGDSRRTRLAELAAEPRTMVLFVSPHRVADDLAELAEALGETRMACLARELTKLHEQVLRAPLGDLARLAQTGFRGELTLVVAGADAPTPELSIDDAVGQVHELVATGMSTKDAVQQVASQHRLSRREVYQATIESTRT